MAEDEKRKLEILLDHWIEHNQEHAEEYARWAVKAKDFGRAVVHDDIISAVQQITKANESLQQALEGMKK